MTRPMPISHDVQHHDTVDTRTNPSAHKLNVPLKGHARDRAVAKVPASRINTLLFVVT